MSSDREVLLALYRTTGGRQWFSQTGWNTDTDISSWDGVKVRDGRVVELDLHNEILKGPIPKELGQLSFLEKLDLRNNFLEGPIPKELAALKNLKVLNLSSNKLTGPIPKELAALMNLKVLNLSSNKLTGSIPKELAQLTSLEELNLSKNKLNGPIPQELAELKKTKLKLWENELTGVLKMSPDRETLLALYRATGGHQWRFTRGWNTDDDTSLWDGVEVQDGRVVGLYLFNKDLRGSIPKELGQLTFLNHLDLSNNKLDSSIPKELGQLKNLKELYLLSNRLTGSIPKELGLLSNLETLWLKFNQLTGSIPKELGQLSSLTCLYLSRNKLSGSIPKELGQLTSLNNLDLWGNKLDGSIPKELGQLTSLTYLTLRNNKLGGSIPKELGLLENLKELDLPFNQLTGPIPKELGLLKNLQSLWLFKNQLTGPIPKELGRLKNLKKLCLPFNQLTGSIPKELGLLSNLNTLSLERNQLTGSIPKELGLLSNLETLSLERNQLTGSIPKELGLLESLTMLLLKRNQLTGSIPEELGLLGNLYRLSLQENQLTGLGRVEGARRVLDLLARMIELSLDGNPWECPPACIVRKGIDWMKKYYDELEKAEPILIDTRKVVFIGESGAGKTSLMKSIMAGKGQLTLEEERETVGVSIQGHVFVGKDQRKGTDVRFYDLAGQVEYYGLHPLFLTETALYVLVWDAWKYQNRTEALVELLNGWLATLLLRAPKSTVLLCATHKDKCAPGNLLAKALARQTGSIPLDEMFKGVEKTIRDKHEQWKSARRTGSTRNVSGVGLKLERGIELVSSSPSVRHGESGLPNLKTRLMNCGKGVRSLIPQSWSIALVVLDALRDGVQPEEAARRYRENEDSLDPVTAHKHIWVDMHAVKLHWNSVVDKLHLNLTPDEQEFVLESVLDLRESGGSLLRHPEGVFLDVENFALSLSPILNHKTHEQDGRGTPTFAGRNLDSNWMLGARTRLVSKGVLEARFARYLWYKEGVDLPPQTFDVLVKMGILLPLPERSIPSRPRVVHSGLGRFGHQDAEEYLVLMRLPLNAPDETMQRFSAFKELEREWGVVAKWHFDYGSVPYGLVERLVASCHVIGKVVTGTYWRRGACFVAYEESMNAAGGSFALALQFDPSSENLKLKKAGTLVVQAFGDRDGLAVWGALRLVISSAWRLFEEFPGLGWEAWIECPTHVGQLQHYLAGVSDTEGRSPGDQLVRRGEPHCACQIGVGSRLGTMLERYPSWADVFKSPDGRDHDALNSDRDSENRFKRGLNEVLNAAQELSTVEEPVESTEGWRTPEWLKDALFAGPAGALTLYETWSPLLKVSDQWRAGAFEKAIPLTIFAVFLAAAVFWMAFEGFRRLRLRRGWWQPWGRTKAD